MNYSIAHIDKNPFSRPGNKLLGVKGIVIHYTASPGASAKNIRNYFQNLSKQSTEDDIEDRSASAHYAVGLDGEVIEIIPLDEEAYHVGAKSYKISFGKYSPNNYLIGIECCHADETGRLSPATYQATVELVQKLLSDFGLNSHNVYRHFDITGKNCPKWFVEHDEDWKIFLACL